MLSQPYTFTLHLLISSSNFLKKLNNMIFIQCQKIGEMMQRIHRSVAIQIVQVLQQNLPWDSNTTRENKEVTQIEVSAMFKDVTPTLIEPNYCN